MRKLTAAAVAIIFSNSLLIAQERGWKKPLEAELKGIYTLTKMDKNFFASRNALKDPGTILVVQQDGMSASDGTGIFQVAQRVKDGKVYSRASAAGPGHSNLTPGSKVYVFDIDVDNDHINFRVVTVDPLRETVKGNTREIRHLAVIRFDFDETFLSKATTADIVKAVSPVLATEDQVATANTKTIELGQTVEDVEKILGKPATVAKLGEKTIYTYKDMKVIFLNGKVSDVQ